MGPCGPGTSLERLQPGHGQGSAVMMSGDGVATLPVWRRHFTDSSSQSDEVGVTVPTGLMGKLRPRGAE